MLVAMPIGLFTAIYLVEYAQRRFRAVVKPVLEILAGIPTVVYGFFAVLTVAPAIRELPAAASASTTSPNSALAAGGGDGHHDHPLHLLALRRRAERGAALHARRLARDGRDPRPRR